jgi:two-component system, NtrC family, nitrogen regulation response regulator GlnG
MPMGTILLADDDQAIRTVVNRSLGSIGYQVRSTGSMSTLWRWISAGEGDVVITDVMMPDGNGLDMLPQIKKLRPDLPIIVMSAQNTLLTAVRATERGAFDYLPKPFDLNELTGIVHNAIEQSRIAADGLSTAASDGDEDDENENIPLVGRSPAMQEIYRIVARLVATDLTVTITGESGTGKELVARALHDYGRRRDAPFVAINMAAIPKELIESELFGHEKGAFTGAVMSSTGRFMQADGGTLFLDEIGDMPPEAQTRLLRVLQQGEYTTVGGRTPIKTDARIVAATNRDLRQLINQGLFREDLYYRLNVVPIRLPALRERVEDIPDLVNHFLSQAAEEGLPLKTISPEAMSRLKSYPWPGNVRELENLVRRLTALYSEDVIGAEAINSELSEPVGSSPGGFSGDDENLGAAAERHLARYFDAHGDQLPPDGLYERVLCEVERPLILLSLAATRGNQVRAADLLGLNRNTLRKKIRNLGIQVTRSLK